ncbi:hypothetical protein ColKHC_04934 [Colletotrichum higginsianum]|uniref:Uncharacterized protein n=1 Tax=Colletotrichum higginsianum TaxID=80884 RepID=A0A4T0W7V6_9PEZI|nr:hypothetical protein CH35J_003469 [Colletotrichum higginsianum]GJC96108.1 hypothetical protein ColKHC_04934 [Colletotrichum higginsianum]
MARRTHYDEAHDPSFDFPYSLPSSQASEDSQVSQDSTGSDAAVVGEDEYVVWRSTRADFEDWADFEIWADFWTRRWCRWKCCRCGFINRMPRYELTVAHCRNPGRPGLAGSCPRDESGETHMGPGGCCLILVPWEVISAVLE